MRVRHFLQFGLFGAIAIMLAGCPAAGVYRTAKTLEPGVGDFNTNFSVTKLKQTTATTSATASAGGAMASTTDSTDLDTEITIPNILGEYAYHLGVAENFEAGGRIAVGSGLMELDVKYRFLGGPDSQLHVAVNPAIGYQTALFVEGISVSLPLILTYDLTSVLSVTAAGFIRYAALDQVVDTDDASLGGDFLTTGGTFGLMIAGETFFLMPTVELGTYTVSTQATGVISYDADDNAVMGNVDSEISTTYMQIGLNIGTIYGREMQKLKKMDEKLDKIDSKLDKVIESK